MQSTFFFPFKKCLIHQMLDPFLLQLLGQEGLEMCTEIACVVSHYARGKEA